MAGEVQGIERGYRRLMPFGSRVRGLQLFAQRFARNRGAVLGLICVCLVALVALFASELAPYDPWALGRDAFVPPGPPHWMGTDDLGRDVLSGVLHGGRASLTVGLAAAGMALVIGVSVGSVSGYSRGIVGDALMRLTEMFMVVPRFFLAILIVAFFGSGLEKVIFVIGILSWPTAARLVRAQFLWLREQEFVEAARSLGMGRVAIMLSEILPNALPPAVVAASLEIARAILLEAALSFLGLGDPNVFSWGTMLRDAQPFLRRAWWMSVGPGIAISVVVLAFNLVGDGFNDAMNPRSQER